MGPILLIVPMVPIFSGNRQPATSNRIAAEEHNHGYKPNP